MLKKVLIGLGVVIVLLVVAMLYLNNRNRTLSPPGETALTNAGISVEVKYSRPSVRDRLIFGEEEEGALQPYGVYWRLGANEPTSLAVSEDFVIDGQTVPAGTYVIYAIPRKGEMELRLNSDLAFWGYSEPDQETDLLSTLVRVVPNDKVEQFTIETAPAEGGVEVIFTWDVFKWSLPIVSK